MYAKTFLAALLAPIAVTAQLHELAVRAGLEYFGTALREGALNSDSQFTAILRDTREFGQIVPENGQKWESTQPQRGQFTYAQGDITANEAKRNGQLLRCHTLTWHSQLPSWVSSGSWTRSSLEAVIDSHMSNVMGHYKGQCYHWDVVNEAINDDGTWRDSVFYRVFGTDYLPISFKIAKKYDTQAKLYYNDYNLEYNQAKTNRAVEIVNIIKAAGAPIDGVGFQGHLIVGSTPSRANLATTLRRFTALGVEVAYTELDIRHSSLPASSSAQVTQGNDFANVVGSCLDVKGCVGVTVWSYTDKYSWVPSTFNGAGDALIYDSQFRKKAAWTSISSVLAAAATGAPASSSVVIPPASTTFSTVVASSTRASSTAQATPTQAPTEPEQTRWGQCGGNGWAGPTKCQSPYTCQVLNPWYSQCL
ncbi:family 10 putative glycoside hydrolase [Podospora australis]|uniref:Beta-xylanase n=1 Tax=Podospora australis TaxID=1536484 RepID=A0AAN6WHW4_9PEZI|nr:family 10 putative glycoside hydrolase [Podospora australis]